MKMKRKTAGRRVRSNPVAKHAHKYNRCVVMTDRKREASRTQARKKYDDEIYRRNQLRKRYDDEV